MPQQMQGPSFPETAVASFLLLQIFAIVSALEPKKGCSQQLYPICGPNPERDILGLLSAK
jgi:hypothetical protein